MNLVKQLTEPGWFLEIPAMREVIRYSTLGALEWKGVSWLAAAFDVIDEARHGEVRLAANKQSYRDILLAIGGLPGRPLMLWRGLDPRPGLVEPGLVVRAKILTVGQRGIGRDERVFVKWERSGFPIPDARVGDGTC